MNKNKAITIIGPTGAGKTSIAFELARQLGNGEVINIDKTYIYKHFRIATGLIDSLNETGVPRHLYEFLYPNENVIPPAEYISLIKNELDEISSHNGQAIIEGGSTSYVPELLEQNKIEEFCGPIIGIKLPKNIDLKEKIEKRGNLAIENGLIEEVKIGLEKYKDSLVMTTAFAAIPIAKYLNGLISLDVAKQEIIDGCLQYYEKQMEVFNKYPEIIWLEHDPNNLQSTIDKILKLLK